MKKNILISIMFLMPALMLIAQQGPGPEGKREKIKALKVAYITEQLQLTPEEAQRFWPVYNEFDQKRHALEIEIAGQPVDKRPDIALMTDAEVDQFIQEKFNREEQVLDLKREYYVKFKEVLPVKKVFRLWEAEIGFKRLLLERLQEDQRPPFDPE
jgi:hypothetical protein